jgi:site-specific recombinase XerD
MFANFLIEMSRRDLSADVEHRYLWALRCFFDFLCLDGLVDGVGNMKQVHRRTYYVAPRQRTQKKSWP